MPHARINKKDFNFKNSLKEDLGRREYFGEIANEKNSLCNKINT